MTFIAIVIRPTQTIRRTQRIATMQRIPKRNVNTIRRIQRITRTDLLGIMIPMTMILLTMMTMNIIMPPEFVVFRAPSGR